jgi:REP element-mobilizing transposase RayT
VESKYFYRRKLPHYQPDYKAFFITFSTSKHWRIPESARHLVVEAIRYGDGRRFRLHALVIMPDHVHIILTPLLHNNGPFSIPDIMQAIKGTSAHRINQFLGRKGKVWQDESFDRALRHEEAIEGKINYVLENPVRAGLVKSIDEYSWSWRDARTSEDASTGEDARASIAS